jgi:hypothetical protein
LDTHTAPCRHRSRPYLPGLEVVCYGLVPHFLLLHIGLFVEDPLCNSDLEEHLLEAGDSVQALEVGCLETDLECNLVGDHLVALSSLVLFLVLGQQLYDWLLSRWEEPFACIGIVAVGQLEWMKCG